MKINGLRKIKIVIVSAKKYLSFKTSLKYMLAMNDVRFYQIYAFTVTVFHQILCFLGILLGSKYFCVSDRCV